MFVSLFVITLILFLLLLLISRFYSGAILVRLARLLNDVIFDDHFSLEANKRLLGPSAWTYAFIKLVEMDFM